MTQVFHASALLDISAEVSLSAPSDQPQWFGYLHEDGIAAYPYPFREILYRGQNKRFSPFFPSIARGLKVRSGKMFEMPVHTQAQLVLRLAQSWWFIRELEIHPLKGYAKENNIHLNGMALAQHYGIPTRYLDLTHEFDVAAFFATCRWTLAGWEPVPEGVGIIYRAELSHMKDPWQTFHALGPQPLPRPAEQSAWVVELPLVPSFDGWPIVKIMEFHHDEAVGRHFLDKFDQGNKLFPPDPLAKVADDILTAQEIPSELIDKAIDSFAQEEFGMRKDQRQQVRQAIADTISLGTYRHLLTNDALEPFRDYFEARKRTLSEMRVVIRPVRTELREEDMGEDA